MKTIISSKFLSPILDKTDKSLRFVLLALLLGGMLESTFAQSFLTNGLVAYYPFNGNASDATGNGFNGIIYGGVNLASDRFGNANSAYIFNGVDGYIDIGQPLGSGPSSLSYSGWVKIISRAAQGIHMDDVIVSQRQNPNDFWADLAVIGSGVDVGKGAIRGDGPNYLVDCIGTTYITTNTWYFISQPSHGELKAEQSSSVSS